MIPIQNTVFTPDIKEHELELKTGTTTVGIICDDAVILAADRRATAGHMIANKNTLKVRKVTDSIAITTAGSVSDIQLLYKYLKAELKLKLIRDGRASTVREAANLLSSWVYNLIRRSHGVAHFIVGGYDEAPRLYDVYPDGSTMLLTDYVASGSGSVFALGVLESQYKSGSSVEETVALAKIALKTAMARDSASGNGMDVFVITKSGMEHVVSESL